MDTISKYTKTDTYLINSEYYINEYRYEKNKSLITAIFSLISIIVVLVVYYLNSERYFYLGELNMTKMMTFYFCSVLMGVLVVNILEYLNNLILLRYCILYTKMLSVNYDKIETLSSVDHNNLELLCSTMMSKLCLNLKKIEFESFKKE